MSTDVDGSTTPPAAPVQRWETRGKDEIAEDNPSVDVSATGSQFQDTPLMVPTREHLDVVKRMMVADTYNGRGSKESSQEPVFVTFKKSADTEGVRPSRNFGSASREHLISKNQYGRFLEAHYCVTARECRTATQT